MWHIVLCLLPAPHLEYTWEIQPGCLLHRSSEGPQQDWAPVAHLDISSTMYLLISFPPLCSRFPCCCSWLAGINSQINYVHPSPSGSAFRGTQAKIAFSIFLSVLRLSPQFLTWPPNCCITWPLHVSLALSPIMTPLPALFQPLWPFSFLNLPNTFLLSAFPSYSLPYASHHTKSHWSFRSWSKYHWIPGVLLDAQHWIRLPWGPPSQCPAPFLTALCTENY